MEITLNHKAQAIANGKTECLVVFLPSEKDKQSRRGLEQLPKAAGHIVDQVLKLNDFSGKSGQMELVFSEAPGIPRILLIGLGTKSDVDLEGLRRAGGKIGKKLHEMKISKLAISPPDFLKRSIKSERGTALIEGIVLGAYQFKTYKSKKSDQGSESVSITCYDPKKLTGLKAMQLGKLRGDSANFARTLGNTPASDLTPKKLSEHAKDIAKEHNMSVKVLEEEEMAKLGMEMLLGVSKGSREPAKLIIMEYSHKKAEKTVAFVGKGITFDSGGISLKPGKGMDEMKFDMCGAAAVLGAMKAIGTLRPKLNVIGVIPSSENLPDGQAQRPGDIVKSYAGKRVEILNTDAEGRLILGDALTYIAKKFKPDAMIDLATLTGACVVALGNYASGAITNNEALCDRVVAAGKSSGDRIWPLPNFPEYEESLKGKYGDLQNIGGPSAGAITAGLFLKNFVEDVPWVHLDIAGTAWDVKGIDYFSNSGATGVGVRLLIDLVNQWNS
ncbi:MAG: leucyl aminopeptidase [SAR324 cluster bacterium]|nr:leucyl aminopeptidase [SAR324 cluster bacterium]